MITCIITSCEKVFFEPEPADDPEALFESFWASFNENYGPFEERNMNWQEQYDLYRPVISATTMEDELYEVFTSLLAPLNDGHTNLFAPGKETFNANIYFEYKIDDALFNLAVIKNSYLQNIFETGTDDSYYYGMIGDIIYIHFPYVYDNFHIINTAIDDHSSAKGMIIDLRHNMGGDFTWAYSEMGRLTSEKRLVFSSKTKNGPAADAFTEWFDWYIEPAGSLYNKKVVVLTDRYTISAGERATMAFEVLPTATLIGDTTNGAHSTMVGGELANGWTYTFPTQKVISYDGNSYEGIGIAPDIVVKNSTEELLSGTDAVLDKAIEQF
ncbi:MAG: S41 family peptidase [Chitinophagales bacterium]|nr:S41 family peptidase [Chitinophagales bacterium]